MDQVLRPTPSSPTVDHAEPSDASSSDDSLERAVAEVCRKLSQHLRKSLADDASSVGDADSLRQRLGEDLDVLLRESSGTLSAADRQSVLDMVVNDVFDYGPISGIMRDSDVSDILINGPFQIFVEKRGQLIATDITFDDESHLLAIVHRLVRNSGRTLNGSSPLVDVRLSDGSRMNAILNPPAINGPVVSIRRFGARPMTAEDLLKKETMTQQMLDFLKACVRCRCNIVISGGTGSGKTTLLNALSRFIRSSERIATIEDTAELELQQPHVVKFEATDGDDGSSEITQRMLMKNTLRIRPDRIIMGECRGPEILEMLQAMNTGHEGSMTTIHANSPREALSRIELMVGLGGVEIPLHALRKQMASTITFIVQVARLLGGRRKVVSISEVTGIEGEVISMHEIFHFEQTSVEDDVAVGHFRTDGNRPFCYERLKSRGAELPADFFRSNQVF